MNGYIHFPRQMQNLFRFCCLTLTMLLPPFPYSKYVVIGCMWLSPTLNVLQTLKSNFRRIRLRVCMQVATVYVSG